jgi:serine/threonine-protein kinase
MDEPPSLQFERGALVGTVVAGHELVSVIAVGSMGEVYLAKHQTLGVSRALKVIRADLRERAQSLARFTREAQVLARLQHNSIVQIVEFGSLENGWPFLAMEYVDGPSLDELVQVEPLPLGPALLILEQLALALHYAHSNNVVHRDLKPANILVRSGDVRQVKLIDFGLARVVDADAERITGNGQTIGSPVYMAPEQVENDQGVTSAVDIYALAGIAYTLLSGAPPFSYKASVRLMMAHAKEMPPRLTERCPHLPPLLDDLLAACLAKEPRHRPAGDQLATELRRILRASEPAGEAAISSRIEVVPAPSLSTAPRDLALLVLDTPVPNDVSGRGLLLANRIMGLVEEIATHLSFSNPELLSLIRLEVRIREQLADHDRELVSVIDQLERRPGDDALEKRHEALREQIRTLNAQQLPLQRRMVEVVEAHRPDATGTIRTLFEKIDRALDELEILRRGN